MTVEMVTIPKAEYDLLLEKLEDLEDILAYEQALQEKSDPIPHEFVMRLINGENPLAVFREWRGYNQSSLARASGVNRTQIADIEADRSNPSVKTLKKLAETLKVDMEDLV